MDLSKALQELYREKERLDRAIARIESRIAVTSAPTKRSTRGRKSMSEEERLQVSARMTAYWTARRAQGGATTQTRAKSEEHVTSEEADPDGRSTVSA